MKPSQPARGARDAPAEHTHHGSSREDTPAAKRNGGAARILVVDDNISVRDVVSRWLTAEGYACRTATRCEEALKLLDHGRFDLIIADVRMPGESGLELLKVVKKHFPDVAVIMATGVDDRETAVLALECGAYGYMLKPFDQNELMINVINALERRRVDAAAMEYERGLEQKVREQTEHLRRSREELVLRLAAATEGRDGETGAHIRRIGLYSELIARRMGYEPETAEQLRLAAPMHDIGKIAIQDSILMKPTRLDRTERRIMQSHTTLGARIFKYSSIPLLNLAHTISLTHHEKWNGEGYPLRLERTKIPEPARIVAVVDVYDALVHARVYRPAIPEDRALQIMARGRATHFDPDIYDVFIEQLPEMRRIRREVSNAAEAGDRSFGLTVAPGNGAIPLSASGGPTQRSRGICPHGT